MSDELELAMARRRRDMTPDFGLFAIAVQIDRLPHTRREDPSTSRQADEQSRPRRASQAMRILEAYATHGALIDESAVIHAGVTGGWKRCSDLRRLGYIAPTGAELPTSMGAAAQVCAITQEGRRALEEAK